MSGAFQNCALQFFFLKIKGKALSQIITGFFWSNIFKETIDGLKGLSIDTPWTDHFMSSLQKQSQVINEEGKLKNWIELWHFFEATK
jgi:hypothetical protein